MSAMNVCLIIIIIIIHNFSGEQPPLCNLGCKCVCVCVCVCVIVCVCVAKETELFQSLRSKQFTVLFD